MLNVKTTFLKILILFLVLGLKLNSSIKDNNRSKLQQPCLASQYLLQALLCSIIHLLFSCGETEWVSDEGGEKTQVRGAR